MYDEVQCGGDLLADRAQGQVIASHQYHRLETREPVARRVGVHGRQRPVMAGVEGLQHVERLGAAHLPHDYAIRTHAQRVAHELADRHLALALDVARPALQAQNVSLSEAKLGGVLDRHDSLGIGNRRRQGVEQGRLAGAGTAGYEDVQARLDAAAQ